MFSRRLPGSNREGPSSFPSSWVGVPSPTTVQFPGSLPLIHQPHGPLAALPGTPYLLLHWRGQLHSGDIFYSLTLKNHSPLNDKSFWWLANLFSVIKLRWAFAAWYIQLPPGTSIDLSEDWRVSGGDGAIPLPKFCLEGAEVPSRTLLVAASLSHLWIQPESATFFFFLFQTIGPFLKQNLDFPDVIQLKFRVTWLAITSWTYPHNRTGCLGIDMRPIWI